MVEINKTENRKKQRKSMKLKVSSLKKINKFDKFLDRLTQTKRNKIQITKIKIKTYYCIYRNGKDYRNNYMPTIVTEQPYTNKLDNTEEMDKFLETQKLPKL